MVDRVDKKPPEARKPQKFHISAKERENFTGNLAILLKASVPIAEALKSYAGSSRSKQLKLAIAQIQGDVDEGYSLYDALKRSGIMSEQTLSLVSLGEKSGNLVENLALASLQEEKKRIFRSKIRSALIYPSFVLGMTVVVGIGVAWFLLPKLAATFSALHVKLPTISKMFINLGLFLQKNGKWAVPAFLAAISLVVFVMFFAPKTKLIGKRLLFSMPGISRLIKEVEIAQFGYLLGTLLQAGLSITDALNLIEKAAPSPQYKKLYKHLANGFENGYSFKTSLSEYKNADKLLPNAVQQLIMAGEKSGALPDTLLHVGKIYEQKADITTQNLEAVLEPVLLLIVWFGVMGVAVAVILPIYSLVGGLNTQ